MGPPHRLAIADVAVFLVRSTRGQCRGSKRRFSWGTLIWHLALFFIGSVAMRGAGCTYNDLADHKIDMAVARTRSRPLPSGRVSRAQAKVFIVLQALAGLVVLLQFNGFAIATGIFSLVFVAIYPFAKRFTNWPQFFSALPFPGVR